MDFGLAENWDAPRKGRDPSTVVGTPGYVAPEQFDVGAHAPQPEGGSNDVVEESSDGENDFCSFFVHHFMS